MVGGSVHRWGQKVTAQQTLWNPRYVCRLVLAQVEVSWGGMLFDVTVCGWMSLWPSVGTAEPARNCKLSCRTSGMWAASDVYFTLSVLYLALSFSFFSQNQADNVWVGWKLDSVCLTLRIWKYRFNCNFGTQKTNISKYRKIHRKYPSYHDLISCVHHGEWMY